MTFRKWCEKYYEDRGMSDNQAKIVVDIVENETPSMSGRWHDDIDEYPRQLLAVVAISLDTHALHWIDENIPKAWFRDMFTFTTE